MNYQHHHLEKCHFDDFAEPSQEALYAAAAAEKLNDVFAWLLGKQGARSKNWNRKSTIARVYTLGVVLGRFTLQSAANEAGVNISAIKRHKADFMEAFGVEQKPGGAIQPKKTE